MMTLDAIKKVYFIGIGGIGMSAIARYFLNRGCEVYGYDKTKTALTTLLEEEGMVVSYEDEKHTLPIGLKAQDLELLVVYTPAIPKDSKILNYFQNEGFELKKRSEVLGIISRGQFCIAVAGTHGKTTTSSIIAHILTDTGFGCTAFLGGIATNFNSNFVLGNNDVVVVEADEYDRSFLTLSPDLAVITSMDADHLDIYGDESALQESFHLFAGKLKDNGTLFVKSGLPMNAGKHYGINNETGISASNIRVENARFLFDYSEGNAVDLKALAEDTSNEHFSTVGNVISYVNESQTLPKDFDQGLPDVNANSKNLITDLEILLPGRHNIENAVAAIAVALKLGIDPDLIKKAVANFKGVKRRFEYVVNTTEQIYIDDYAHHPEELKACFNAVRELYPEKKLTVIFQPHLFSRTRDFADGFAEVLSTVDDLLLLDIYPAREQPIAGIDSHYLLNKITLKDKAVYAKADVLDAIALKQPELLVTVGAGDIDTLVLPLKKLLSHA
jgi:UDP-N-acetylmuramate--alanine ligase